MITIGGRAPCRRSTRWPGWGTPLSRCPLDDPQAVSGQIPELLEVQKGPGNIVPCHYPNEDNPFDVAVLRERFLPRIQALIDLSETLGIGKATMHFWIDRRWDPAGLIPRLELLQEIVSYAVQASVHAHRESERAP